MLDVAQAILGGRLGCYDDLKELAENVTAHYFPPAAGRWYLPRVIMAGGQLPKGANVLFVTLAGEIVEVANCPDFRPYCARSWLQRKLVTFGPEGAQRLRPAYVETAQERADGKTRWPWRLGDPVVRTQALAFAGFDEAQGFHSAYVATAQEIAMRFTPQAFDYLEIRYPLEDERSLTSRLASIEGGLLQATDRVSVREVVSEFEALLREVERLAADPVVADWYSGRDSQEDVPYWIDFERFGDELEEQRAEREAGWRRRLEQEAAEQEAIDEAMKADMEKRREKGLWDEAEFAKRAVAMASLLKHAIDNPATFPEEEEQDLREDDDEPDPTTPDDASERAGQSVGEGAAVESLPPAEPATGSGEPLGGGGGESVSGGVPFRIPGFISEVMDCGLDTAPYPNERLAFAGALAMQAFLVSRKVRDLSDVRPNPYILALAQSGSGKENPRKLNKLIAAAAGLSGGVVETIASAQGLEDALQASPALLFLLDEADALLRAMAGGKDPRLIEIHRALLTLYSASSSDYRMRIKAGEPAGTINQPHLTLFGTAIPKHFFGAMSELMLTNGLVGRMLVIDATGPRVGQPAKIIELPERIVETALYWRDFLPPGNNLNVAYPSPAVILSDSQAELVLRDFRAECDERWRAAAADAEAERTIIARIYETARKLALLYAVSESREDARITVEAARWACDFARQQAGQILSLIGRYGATSPFEQGCQRYLEFLRLAPRKQLSKSVLLKRLRMPARDMNALTTTLVEREEIETKLVPTRGRSSLFILLRGRKHGRGSRG